MKNILFIVALACTAATASAQLSIGISGAANLSDLEWRIESADIKGEVNWQPALAWRAAVLGEYQISKLIALRAEAGMQIKANQLNSDNLILEEPEDIKLRENYQYWEAGFLLQVSPIKKLRQVYALAGGTFGRLTDGWKTIHINGNKRKDDIDIKDSRYNRQAYALDFGLGGNIPLGKNSSLKIEGRYQYGLSEIDKVEVVESRFTTFMLNLGYLHRL